MVTDNWRESMRRQYVCRRVPRPLDLTAGAADPGWNELAWSDPFVDITGSDELQPRFDMDELPVT